MEKHVGVSEGTAGCELKVVDISGGGGRRYEETCSRGYPHPARPEGADQQAGQVVTDQTAAHRAQSVVRSNRIPASVP